MLISVISDQFDKNPDIAFKRIHDLGFEYVELHNINNKTIEQLNDEEIEHLQSLLDMYQLKVSNIASTVFFMCPLKEEYTISLFNDEFHVVYGDVQTHLTYLKRACEIANTLHCPNVRIFPFRLSDDDKVAGTDVDLMLIASHVKEACDVAKEYGVTVCLENCPYSHAPKGMLTLKILEMVSCDNLRLLWDPANSYRAEIKRVPEKYLDLNVEQELTYIKNQIGHVHLKNYIYDQTKKKPFVHVALHKGNIDYDFLLSQMKDMDVIFSLEAEVKSERELLDSYIYLLDKTKVGL